MQRVIGNQALLRRIQRQGGAPRESGLPGPLRAQLEARSGVSLAQVRVHHDSPLPARHEALAFTRGTQIHLGPGQARHLPHEAWHAVQQQQGRVRATGTVAGAPLNDDPALEREADALGVGTRPEPGAGEVHAPAIQRVRADPDENGEWISDLHPGAVMKPGTGYIRVTSFSYIADTWLGGAWNRDHAYVGIEYVDKDAGTAHTVFTDLTDKEVRYSDDTTTYSLGQPIADEGATMRQMIGAKLLGDDVIGTTFRVTADQARAAIARAQSIRGEYGKANPDGKYKFAKSGSAMTEHGINCARFAHKVLKAAGIDVSAGLVANTPFEVANMKDDSSGIKVLDASEPDAFDPEALTKTLKSMPNTTGLGSGLQVKLASRLRRRNLGEDELAAITDWVKGGWSSLNSYVRGMMSDEDRLQFEAQTKNGHAVPTFAARVQALDSALAKLGSFEGTTYRVARPASPEVYAKLIVPGDYVSDRGYWASSLVKGGQAGGSAWGNKGKVHFEIKGHSGHDISQHSPMPGEREVLFGPNVVFKVEAIKAQDDISFVVLREVEPPDDATIKNSYDGSILREPPMYGPENAPSQVQDDDSHYRPSRSSVHV